MLPLTISRPESQDINNLISLETLHSAGTFDLNRVQPPITFRMGLPGEIYAGIGRGEIKIEGLPVFADQSGPFGSTTRDSERTMVRPEQPDGDFRDMCRVLAGLRREVRLRRRGSQ